MQIDTGDDMHIRSVFGIVNGVQQMFGARVHVASVAEFSDEVELVDAHAEEEKIRQSHSFGIFAHVESEVSLLKRKFGNLCIVFAFPYYGSLQPMQCVVYQLLLLLE